MQTILGANGIIGETLAKELHNSYTRDIRIVGRNPQRVHATDEVFQADLLNAEQTYKALAHTDVAYLTVGVPLDSATWLRQWPEILRNVIDACSQRQCKLVYFDNTYAYPQNQSIQQEGTPLVGKGKKGRAKKMAAELLLQAMARGELEAAIARAPEFYGPGKTKGITNGMVFRRLRKGLQPKIPVKDNTLRTLIYTPDAGRATALIGNTPDAFGQTWHLPCDDNRLAYKEIIQEISRLTGREVHYAVLHPLQLHAAALFKPQIREMRELLPRYGVDNLFDSSKFKARFPNFSMTSYMQGIENVLRDYNILA